MKKEYHDYVIKVCLTKDEKDTIMEAAKIKRKCLSTYIRSNMVSKAKSDIFASRYEDYES